MGRTTPKAFGRACTVCTVPFCEYAVVRHGDRWAHCEKAMDPATLDGRVELNPEYLDGPTSNCPDDRWGGVPPMDVPAIAADNIEQETIKSAEKAVALLKAFDPVMPSKEQDVRDKLSALVADGHMTARVAAKAEATLISEIGLADAI